MTNSFLTKLESIYTNLKVEEESVLEFSGENVLEKIDQRVVMLKGVPTFWSSDKLYFTILGN